MTWSPRRRRRDAAPPRRRRCDHTSRAAQVYDGEESKWVGWMSTIDEYKVDSKLSFAELIVPTPDSVRSTFILAKLLQNRYHCMMVGETGTGKTVNISQYLQGVSKCEGKSAPAELMPLTMTFSAQTCRLGVQCCSTFQLEVFAKTPHDTVTPSTRP